MLDSRLSDIDRYPLKLSDLIVTSINNDMAYEKYVWAANPENRADELPNVGLSGDYFYRPMEKIGELLEYQGSVMSIDPSGRGQDETAYSCAKFLNGQIFITAAGGFRGGYNEVVLAKLAKLAKEQNVNLIQVEENFGAGMMIVPLNALMQANSPEDGLGSMLAGKNWLQNIAMISLLIFTVFLANLSFGSEFILYFNAFIAVVGFSIVLRKLKAIL